MLSKMYKLIFDLSICFILGGFILKFFLDQRIYIGSFLILIFTALILFLLENKRKYKYIILIAIPLPYLLIATLPISELIVFLFILAYLAYVIITNRYEFGRGEFVDMIKHVLILSLILIFPMLVNFSRFRVSIEVITPYLVVAIISAVFLLRNLRVGNEMEQMKIYEKQQFIELTLFLVICILLTLIKAPLHLLEGAKLLYQYLVIPVLVIIVSILGGILYGILYLVLIVIDLVKRDKSSDIRVNVSEVIGQTTNAFIINKRETFSILPILYFVGAVVAITILFFFFRFLRGNIYMRNIPNGTTEIRETLDNNKSKKDNSKIKLSKNPRESVRYYYGKYMVWLESKQVQLNEEDTTKDINDKYKELVKDKKDKMRDAEEFGKLYKDARYQMTREISEDEATRMKGLYQIIKTQKYKK